VIATAKSNNFTISNDKGSPAIQKASLTVDKPAKAVAILTPIPTTLASVDTQVQKRRDNDRRRILEDELNKEEQSLETVRGSMLQEQQNPTLVAAVRAAQQTADPTPAQLVEMRNAIDKASGRIRGLQATAAEHEKNVEALRKELGALKP
jgi:chromosome segregation ATPase